MNNKVSSFRAIQLGQSVVSTVSGSLYIDGAPLVGLSLSDAALSGTTVLTVGNTHHDTFTANRTLSFSNMTPQGGSSITLFMAATSPCTLTFPSSYRIGYSGAVTSLSFAAGNHELSWTYSDGKWWLADTAIDTTPISYAQLQSVSASNKVLGRATTGAGVVEEITIGGGLVLSSATLRLPTPLEKGSQNEIWISIRSDNVAGTGTKEDPFDGSTRAKFDGVMTNLFNAGNPNLHIHLGAGTFQTQATNHPWQPLDGWTIEGQGMYITTIQAAPGSWYVGVHYHASVIEVAYNAFRSGITIKDLTVDANFLGVASNIDDGIGSARTLTSSNTISGSANIYNASGGFSRGDLVKTVTGTGIPAGARILRIPTANITNSSDGTTLTGIFVINVDNTADFRSSGSLIVESTTHRFQIVSYTGKTSTSFTGCTGGSGVLHTGGKVTTDTQAILTTNATATSSSVSLSIGGEKRIALGGIGLCGSNHLVERVRVINVYGSSGNSNGPYGGEAFEMFAISIAGPNDAARQAVYNNHIRFCVAESPYGTYGNAFIMFGQDIDHPMRNSSIENCHVFGIGTGWGGFTLGVSSPSVGFNNSAYGISFAKDCQVIDNEAVDAGNLYYCDTGQMEDILIARNRGTQVVNGVLITQGSNDWYNRNVQILDNYIECYNSANAGDNSNGIRVQGNINQNIVIARNRVKHRMTGRSSDGSGHALAVFRTTKVLILDNIFDEVSRVYQIGIPGDTDTTGVYKRGNRGPGGEALTAQDGLADTETSTVTFSTLTDRFGLQLYDAHTAPRLSMDIDARVLYGPDEATKLTWDDGAGHTVFTGNKVYLSETNAWEDSHILLGWESGGQFRDGIILGFPDWWTPTNNVGLNLIAVDSIADNVPRTLTFDLKGGNRYLGLSGDFGTIGTGSLNFTLAGNTNLTLPTSGTVARLSDLPTNFNVTAVKTANYTATVNDLVPVDTTSGDITISLPSAPADKSRIAIKLITIGSPIGHTVTVARGGSDVFNKSGGATSLSLFLLNQGVVLQYKASGGIWYVISTDVTVTSLDGRYAGLASGSNVFVLNTPGAGGFNVRNAVSGFDIIRGFVTAGAVSQVGFFNVTPSPQLSSPDVGTALTTFGLASGTPTFNASHLTGTAPTAIFAGGVGASSATFLRGDGTWTTTFNQMTAIDDMDSGAALIDVIRQFNQLLAELRDSGFLLT